MLSYRYFCGAFCTIALDSFGSRKVHFEYSDICHEGWLKQLRGAHMLVEKSYQKKKTLNEPKGKCSSTIRCLTLTTTLLPPHLPLPIPSSPKRCLPVLTIKFPLPGRARKGSHCTVRAQVSKCSLKPLKAFRGRATKDTSKTSGSPYKTSDIVVTGSGHSALGWHLRR